VPTDSFDAVAAPNVVNAVTANDLTMMDAIGWDPAGSIASSPPPPPLSPPPPSPDPVTITGTAGNDTIIVANIVTTGPATPTFIYGLAGNDTINATGMTGAMSATGGAGADKMTGGSGQNSYLFALVGDSTSSGMDVVTNFHAVDVLDFRGLGLTLTYGGNIPAARGNGKKSVQPTIAAHSVGWQQSAGNTFVYVNTRGSSESLTSADMKVELVGSVSLTSSNIMHL
jgi:Ca2+-binding RTX toxin-like protein